jgi:S-adenosyl-L-methionine hydrolase (adenosine-forming)
MPPCITLLTDYGLVDDFVGVCHGVIATICPDARVIDLTHGIAAHDVRSGAAVLARSLRYLPVGVHVAVVDPGVGGTRRAVALRTADGRILVGPDNGLLWPAATGAGGIVEAVEVSHSPLRLEPVSATFHGRDIFAPVAAHLANGVAVADAGEPLDPEHDLVVFEFPHARIEGATVIAEAVSIDRFGNVQLAATHEDVEAARLQLGRPVELQLPGGSVLAGRFVRTFSETGVGELIVYEDASRQLAVAINHGSAAARLGLRTGSEVRIASLAR